MQQTAVATITHGEINAEAIGVSLTQNRSLRELSGTKVQALLDQWPEIGPETDLLATDKLDADMADAQSKLQACITICENRRKPITQLFDEIRGLFTAEEKSLEGMKVTIANSRSAWQREKLRREKIRKEEDDKKLIKQAEAIDIAAKAKTLYQQNLVRLIAENIAMVNKKFNEHTAETLPKYREVLEAWTPGFNDKAETYCKKDSVGQWLYHSTEEITGIVTKAYSESFQAASASYVREMNMEKNRLIELIPSRIAELIRGNQAEIDARLLREESERKLTAETQVQNVEQAVAVSAEAEKHEAVFEAAATAGPTIQIAKGTSQKKKYAPETMAEHHKILVYWVEKAMPKLTQDELIKVLSFMRTFANKALNDGEVIQGVPVVDDVTVRGRRKDDD